MCTQRFESLQHAIRDRDVRLPDLATLGPQVEGYALIVKVNRNGTVSLVKSVLGAEIHQLGIIQEKRGEPKLTPVQSIENSGLVCVRTDPRTLKARRIRRNSRVRIVPSDRSGRPIGTWVEGEAHVVEGGELERMMKVFKKEYGAIGNPMISLVGRPRGERLTAVISIKLQAQPYASMS